MDLSTSLGLLVGWGAIMLALILEGGKPSDLVNVSAFVIVFGGTTGATVISFPLKSILAMPGIIKNAFFCKQADQLEIIRTVVEFARVARKEGILALENRSRELDNRFLRMGVQLVVDGTPSQMVREVLETEILSLQERHKVGENILAAMGGYAPTMGIIGTVMGLVHMLASLDEPGKMGPAIASAFIATLYGVMSANLAFLPLSAKLKARTAEEVVAYDMIVEGILSIQAGDGPRLVETKMSAYLPPKLRAALESESGSQELTRAA